MRNSSPLSMKSLLLSNAHISFLYVILFFLKISIVVGIPRTPKWLNPIGLSSLGALDAPVVKNSIEYDFR